MCLFRGWGDGSSGPEAKGPTIRFWVISGPSLVVHEFDPHRLLHAVAAADGRVPAGDLTTLVDVEEYGVNRLLDELEVELKAAAYRPLPARRVFIPKPGRPGERRPLSIPWVRDRVVQSAR